MRTVKLLFRTPRAKTDEQVLDKVHGCLAALLHNGQIVADHTPMARVRGGLMVTVSLPEADSLADRFTNKWVRKSYRALHLSGDGLAVHWNRPGERFANHQLSSVDSELSTDGRQLARQLEKKMRAPVYYYLSKHWGRSDQAERKRRCPSCGKAWLRDEPLHRIFDFQCRRCRLLSNVAFDVRLGA